MKQFGFKDFLVVCAFGLNVASMISYAMNISIWATLIMSTGVLAAAVLLIMGNEE